MARFPTLGPGDKVRDKHLPDRLSEEALDGSYVPLWQPNTAYALGALTVSPTTGQIGTAKAAFTSGATYNAANWNLASGASGVTVTDNGDGTLTLTSGGSSTVTDAGDGTLVFS